MKSKYNSTSLRAYLISCFAVLFLTVSTFAFILVKNFNYIDARTSQMNATVQAIADLQELRGDTKAAEANLKDAFLRNTEEYMTTYYECWKRYPKRLAELEKEITPRPVTLIEFQDLKGIVNRRFQRYDVILKMFREGGGLKALTVLQGTTVGAEINAHIDSTFKSIIDKETTYLHDQEQKFRIAEKLTTQFLVVLLLFIVVTFVFGGYIIRIVFLQDQEQKILTAVNSELEGKVHERTAELEEINKEMESFSYSVSHDLRAPLRAIEGFSNILMEDSHEELGEEGVRRVSVIITNVRQMGRLIDDILNFSRLGRKGIAKTTTDMTKLAEQVLVELKQSENIKEGAQINIQDLGFAQVDSTIFRQVFTNLMGNAIKFSSREKTPEITVGVLGTSPQTYFVRDNGVGFDMKHANKLFNVFQRLHSRDEFEGTGVGLAIVKKIITKHGGRVWVESSVGSGATFYFSLA